jgi:hypothetical protein
MSEGAGEFMADRFKNEVWPVLSQQLGSFVERQARSEGLLEDDKIRARKPLLEYRCGVGPHRQLRHDSEKSLIQAIMDCLQRVFGQHDCGRSLSVLVPLAGIVVLPFLDDDDEVTSATFQALQRMAAIDSDALWRPLLHLMGQSIPRRPLKPHNTLSIKNDPKELPSHPLALKARELLDFIESLPEQALY